MNNSQTTQQQLYSAAYYKKNREAILLAQRLVNNLTRTRRFSRRRPKHNFLSKPDSETEEQKQERKLSYLAQANQLLSAKRKPNTIWWTY